MLDLFARSASSAVSGGGIASNRHDFLVINGWARHTGWLHGFMKLYAGDGIVLFALLLLVGWWLARRSGSPAMMAAALWAPVATLLAVGINQPIVKSVHEARPYTQLHDILVLAHRSADPSFPSDHATMAGAVAVALFYVNRRLGIVAGLAALLLAFSRVYIAAHWPRDVVAGLVLGALVAIIGHLLVTKPLTRLVSWAEGTALRPLLTSGDAVPAEAETARVHAPVG